MNKKLKITIVCFAFFLILIISLIFIFNKNKTIKKEETKKEEKQTEEKWIKYKEENNNVKIINFYENENEEIIAEFDNKDDIYKRKGIYYCENSDCKIYDTKDNYAYLYDNNSYYFFDYVNKLIRKSKLNSDYKEIKIVSYDNNLYGLILKNKNDKVGFYNLDEDDISIDFNYDYFNDNYVTLLKENIIGYNYNEIENKSFIINIKNGNILYEIKNNINIINNEDNLYYYICDNNINIYNDKFKQIINDKEISKFGISSKGNIVISNSNFFEIFNNNGTFIKKSKEFKDILLILNDYVIVIDNDDYLKIMDYDSNLVHSFDEVKENYYFNSEFSGLYKKEDKYGIYLIFENRETNKSYQYYFIPKTKKYGVIEEDIVNKNEY